MAWSQSPTETTAENSGELGSSRAVLGLDVKQGEDREMVSDGSGITNQRRISAAGSRGETLRPAKAAALQKSTDQGKGLHKGQRNRPGFAKNNLRFLFSLSDLTQSTALLTTSTPDTTKLTENASCSTNQKHGDGGSAPRR